MTYNKLVHEYLPFEILYRTKDAFGKWQSERLHRGYWSRDDRDAALQALIDDVNRRHLTHVEYWANTNKFELDRQQAAKVRSGHDVNAII